MSQFGYLQCCCLVKAWNFKFEESGSDDEVRVEFHSCSDEYCVIGIFFHSASRSSGKSRRKPISLRPGFARYLRADGETHRLTN